MMDVNGGNMGRRLQKETHVHEHTIAAQLHHLAQLENRYSITT